MLLLPTLSPACGSQETKFFFVSWQIPCKRGGVYVAGERREGRGTGVSANSRSYSFAEKRNAHNIYARNVLLSLPQAVAKNLKCNPERGGGPAERGREIQKGAVQKGKEEEEEVFSGLPSLSVEVKRLPPLSHPILTLFSAAAAAAAAAAGLTSRLFAFVKVVG